ncbi:MULTISPECIES: GNAT family N-acetyltransferase [Paenibacillus]|uniref:acetyltransferase n=1 Tax=Paenibacillus TaxID=44249 RepID=UPI0022B8B6DB|nr:acetyltransferase [Paenibacillus caseinilyticus]MCZ8520418.1 acetyltransferase [Paenibacillus caseinilyticus]
MKGIPDPYFNSGRGLTNEGLGSNESLDELDSILAFYAEHGAACRLDIVPWDTGAELLGALAERGYVHYGFHASLYVPLHASSHTSVSGPDRGQVNRIASRPERISVRPLGSDEFSLFGDIYVAAFGMPDFLREAVAANNRILCDRPGWHFYLASYDGQPAAVGVLHVKDGAGSLAAAATLPSFRERGCQSALIAERLEEAARQACGLVVGQARFGSGSHANMERSGMRTAYTKALWRKCGK